MILKHNISLPQCPNWAYGWWWASLFPSCTKGGYASDQPGLIDIVIEFEIRLKLILNV
jgi:hypothetical protein